MARQKRHRGMHHSGPRLVRKRHLPVGSRPGTLAIPPDAHRPRLKAFCYTPERLEEVEIESLDQLPALLEGDHYTWVDVQGVGDADAMRRIGSIFSIHPRALADVVNVPNRPSIQLFPSQVVMIARAVRPGSAPGSLELEQVGLVISEKWLLTIQERHDDGHEPVRQRLRYPEGMIRQSAPGHLAYAILDSIVDGYYPLLEAIGEHLEKLEKRVLDDPSSKVLAEINRVKRELLRVRRALWPLREAINSLIRDQPPQFSETTLVYMRGCYDHCVQMLEVIESCREVASGLSATYLSSVGNRTNDVMKMLTIMASIFIPLTFLAGIYGMNFEHMPELGWQWSYPTLLISMATVAAGMLIYFLRLGWIGSKARKRAESEPESQSREPEEKEDF